MALVTRCSNTTCLTLFRVTPAQLQAFGGQVRCGTCGTVFDAFPSLATVADASLKVPGAAAAPAQTAAHASAGPALEPPVAEAPAALDHPATVVEPEPEHNAAPPAAFHGDPIRAEVPEVSMTRAEVAAAPAVEPEAAAAHAPAADLRMTGPEFEQPVLSRPATAATDDAPAQRETLRAHDPEPVPALDTVAEARPYVQSDPAPAAFADHDVDPTLDAGSTYADSLSAHQAQHDAGSLDTSPTAEHFADPAPSAAPELTDYSVTRGPPVKPDAVRAKWADPRLLAGAALLALIGAAAAAWFMRSRLPPPAAAFIEQTVLSIGRLRPGELARTWGAPLAGALALLLFYLLRRFRAIWIGTAIALMLVLGVQLLHAYRTPLAASYPGLRPVLERFCALARCEVGLPRAAGELVIEASDLQALDVAKPNLIQLSATVRNRAATALAYPAIEVTLTDPQDKPLARRVLLPDQYLARRPDDRVGLRAGEEFTVKLTLDTTELRPVGYRLYLFYP